VAWFRFEPLYWSYLHTNGTIQIKMYMGEDIEKAYESPFVLKAFGPGRERKVVQLAVNYTLLLERGLAPVQAEEVKP